MKKLILILISFSTLADISRLSFETGATYVTYAETHQFQASKDKEFNQTAPRFNFDGILFVIPFWAYVGISTKYIGPVLSSSTTDKSSFLYYSSYAGFVIPAKPFNLQIESEYFVDTMSPNLSTFGYKDLKGTKFSIIGDWVSQSGQTQLNIKYPFWIGVEGRSELSTKLIFYMGTSNQEVPPTLKKGFNISFNYNSMTLTIPGSTEVEIKTQEIGMNLGFNW